MANIKRTKQAEQVQKDHNQRTLAYLSSWGKCLSPLGHPRRPLRSHHFDELLRSPSTILYEALDPHDKDTVSSCLNKSSQPRT